MIITGTAAILRIESPNDLLSIGVNPEIVLCYLKLCAPFSSGAISVLQFILIYKDFGRWEREKNGLILYLDNEGKPEDLKE